MSKSTEVQVGNKLVWRNGSGTAARIVEIVRVAKDARSFWVVGLKKGRDRFKSNYVRTWGEYAGTGLVEHYGAPEWGSHSYAKVYPWTGETDEGLAAEVAEKLEAAKVRKDKEEAERKAAYDAKLADAMKANVGRMEMRPLYEDNRYNVVPKEIDGLVTMSLVNYAGDKIRLIIKLSEGSDWDHEAGGKYECLVANVTATGGDYSGWSSWSSEKAKTLEELVERIVYRMWW